MTIKVFYYEIEEFSYFECNEFGVLYRFMMLNSKHEIKMLPNKEVLVTKDRFTKDTLQKFIEHELNPEVVKLCYKKRTLAELLRNDPYYPLYVELSNKYDDLTDIPFDELTHQGELDERPVPNIKAWQFNLLKKEFENIVVLTVNCQHCGSEHKIYVERQDLEDYKSRKCMISVFNYLSNSDRELIISQTCDDCWHRLMKEE